MNVTEIIEEAKKLKPHELDRLLVALQYFQATADFHESKAKTGIEIVAQLNALDAPIDLINADIDDPVEWVKEQRNKRQAKRDSYGND